MCGITGAYSFTQHGEVYLTRIRQAKESIAHRGPDGSGVYTDNIVALGHRRLSIIDTSEIANQPMHSACGRYVVVFNGEIFNYQELKDTYLNDHVFRSHSDTEVMLELYAKLGVSSFSKLRGFFAAAFYDMQAEQVIVVRDRFGKKPLHIYEDKDVFLFASELKAILAFGVAKKINKQALTHYMQFNYVPQPSGILEGVTKVAPGHYIMITKQGVLSTPYYKLAINTSAYGEYTYDMACKRLENVMDEAVRLRLISDVPLGAFLSGGIDSSVIVALAARYTDRLRTFAVGFKNNSFFDETGYAQLVAKKFNTDHTIFSIHEDDCVEEIGHILDSIDEPFADASAIPTYMLSKLVRQHVTVALSGDGGDEVFAGYNKHKAEWYIRNGGFKKNIATALFPIWNMLPQSRNNSLSNKARQLARFAHVASLTAADRYWSLATFTPVEEVAKLLKQHIHVRNPMQLDFSTNDFNHMLLADMNFVLPGDMLVKTDMMSMANSLEVRCPFLDQEVVQFAFGLPASYKIGNRGTKLIVRDAFKKILPAELYNRPKKGFDIPLGSWLKNQLSYLLQGDLFSPQFIEHQGIFNLDAVSQLKKKFYSTNPGDTQETLWAIIVFQHWWKKNMEG